MIALFSDLWGISLVLTFPAVDYSTSLPHTTSKAFIVSWLSDDGRSNWVELTIHCSSWAFPWYLVILSIYSCVCEHLDFIFEKNACSCPLVNWSDSCWIPRVFHGSWILIIFSAASLQIFSSILFMTSSLCWWFPLKCRKS